MQSHPGLSVIIPTFNRAATLVRVLDALARQTLPPSRLEVIVVDDGSTDDTPSAVDRLNATVPYELRYFHQPNKKQAAARNLGLRYARHDLVLFLGDDTIPEPTCAAEHLRCHAEHSDCHRLAVVGYTTWPEGMEVTPFLRYIGEWGPQFGYSLVRDGQELPFTFFYTSNLSLPRHSLGELDYVFDERFRCYGWEDIELAYRLQARGMRLVFHRAAVTRHDHPTDIRAFLLRQRTAGAASREFLRRHPQLKRFLGSAGKWRLIAAFDPLTRIAAPVADWIDRRARVPLPGLCYQFLLQTSYARGVLEGIQAAHRGAVSPCAGSEYP